MKNPNGYGSVYKLSGKRRKPFAVRKTVGWNEKGQPKYEFIGYYETRKEAIMKLAEYNQNPYDLKTSKITFGEVYDLWFDEWSKSVCEGNITGIKGIRKICTEIENMKMSDIKLCHLQKVADDSGKTTPTLKKYKSMLNGMWDYCIKNEILPSDKKNIIRYVDIKGAGNPNKMNRRPFKKSEIKKLWKYQSDDRVKIILMLIYTGVRIRELLELKKDEVYMDEKYFYVNKSKTEAGVREVPIADKVMKFFEYWMQKDSQYLLSNNGNQIRYDNYLITYWSTIMKELEFPEELNPHCCRYTCISMLTETKCDERVLKQIVGHKGQNVTEKIYTHIDLPTKLEAINKI